MALQSRSASTGSFEAAGQRVTTNKDLLSSAPVKRKQKTRSLPFRVRRLVWRSPRFRIAQSFAKYNFYLTESSIRILLLTLLGRFETNGEGPGASAPLSL